MSNVMLDGQKGLVVCVHCGAEFEPELPMMLRAYREALDEFRKKHAACSPQEERN
jgi:hypothetical protein